MYNRKIIFGISCLMISNPFIPEANAATINGTLQIKVNVEQACNLNSGDNSVIDFGTWGKFSGSTKAQTAESYGIELQCTKGIDYKIGLDNGLNPTNAVDFNDRRMKFGTNYIKYYLYKEVTQTNYWGSIASGYSLSATSNGDVQKYPVFAGIPAQATPAAGQYSDTVKVEVTY